MSQFMAQQGGKLSLVVQRQHNAAGGGNTAAGKCVGIDIGGVYHPERIGHMGAMG